MAPLMRALRPTTTKSNSASSGNPASGPMATNCPSGSPSSRRDCAMMPSPAKVPARSPLRLSLEQATNQFRPAFTSASIASELVMEEVG
jgi:hypothetical protein